jgi:peptidoglycan-N-acetylglucosamine deacetylase
MLKYKNISVIFLFLLFIGVIYDILYHLPLLFFLILILSYFVLLVYGSSTICSNIYIETVCSAKTDKKEIAITFDDGPVHGNTDIIINILNEFHVQAAFFMIGIKAKSNRDLVKIIDESSHLICGHSFSHSIFYDFYSRYRVINDLEEFDNMIFTITNKRINLFRPPYGVTNPALKSAVDFMKYTCVGWSIRSYDTSIKDHQKVLNVIKKQIKPGAIILLHDTTEYIGELLRELLIHLKQNEYSVVRLDKMLKVNAYKS